MAQLFLHQGPASDTGHPFGNQQQKGTLGWPACVLGDTALDFTRPAIQRRARSVSTNGSAAAQGRALLAPGRLHAGVHHRTGPHRQAQGRVRQAQRQGHRRCRSTRSRSHARVDRGHQHDAEDRRGASPSWPTPTARSPSCRPDPPECQHHGDGALAVRDRPEQEGAPHHHLPGQHRPQLRRDPARDRLAAAHRLAQRAPPRAIWKDGDDVVIVPSIQDLEVIKQKFPKGCTAGVTPYLRLTPQPNK